MIYFVYAINSKHRNYIYVGLTNNLQHTLNLDGSKVRTKPAPFAKAPEMIEVLAEISAYNDGKSPPVKLYSEIADIFYNLIQLQVTDSQFALGYEEQITTLANTLGLSTMQVKRLVIAKYHTRFYTHKGVSVFEEEEAQIALELENIPIADQEKTSRFYDAVNILWNQILSPRLQQLAGSSHQRNLTITDRFR